MSGAARSNASGGTEANTAAVPTDAAVAVTMSPSANPAQAARSPGAGASARLKACGAATRQPVNFPSLRSTETSTKPASSSNRSIPPRSRPRPARTQAAPTFGCPANGTSACGVKMRTRAVLAGLSGGSTKAVSLRLNSRASACMVSASSPAASGRTASGLPPNR